VSFWIGGGRKSEGILHSRNAKLDLTEEECAEVIQAIRAAIDGDRYVLSPRVRRPKGDETLRKVLPPKNG
jgi:hypothetical protein